MNTRRLTLFVKMLHLIGTGVAAAPGLAVPDRAASPPPPKPRPGAVVHVDPPQPPTKRAARRLRGTSRS